MPQGEIVVPAAVHALAWVLMIAAMMLPTTWPLLAMFRRITAARPDAGRLVAAGGDRLPRSSGSCSACSRMSPTSALRALAVALGLAVAARLDCRRRRAGGGGRVPVQRAQVPLPRAVPRAVRVRRLALAWRSAGLRGAADRRRPRRVLRRLLLGADALMFVVGIGSVGWMLALAAVIMAAEKNLPWGRRLRTPLGLGLLGWAVALLSFGRRPAQSCPRLAAAVARAPAQRGHFRRADGVKALAPAARRAHNPPRVQFSRGSAPGWPGPPFHF